ncbi:MAG: hypothetical protein NTX33_14765 [Propionibacteriales bacterium]|nr:hypothetical protein [Propionibacteriales bacterium]
MTTPTFCIDCGHELGIGRFCTNCGKPVPGRHPEAMPHIDAPTTPRATAPVVPPSADQLPPSARYPLYAEAPPTVVSPAMPPPPMPPPMPPPAPSWLPEAPSYDAPRPVRAWWPWAIALVVLAVVAGLGALLLIGGGDDENAADEVPGAPTSAATAPSVSGTDEPEKPDSTGTGAPADAPDPEDVIDLTAGVSAEVPAVAPPSRDRQNQPVKFVAANMWDGSARTTWRMPGDGTGETLTFDLGAEVVLTDVGMINGYAKIDGPTNWYTGNRRVRAVQWEFDDGTRVTQEFADKQTMQMAMIGPVRTATVTVHLLTVTEPGKGTNGRDFTAISEVRFLGAPG